MQDSESQKPLRQSARQNGAAPHDDEEDLVEMAVHDPDSSERPTGSFPAALLYGVIAGVACAVLNVIITFVTAPISAAVAHEGAAVTSNTLIAAGLGVLEFLLPLLACYLAGSMVGRTTLQRSAGFYAGAITGLLFYIISFFVRYIPNYPGTLTATHVTSGQVMGGIIITIVFLFIWGFIGGLLGLWGISGTLRRKHGSE